MADFMTAADIRRDLRGAVDPGDDAGIVVLIQRAEAQLDAKLARAGHGSLRAVVQAGTAVTLVQQVISDLVCTALRNPMGYRSYSNTEGPYGSSATFADGAGGRIVVTDAHLEQLVPAAAGAFTIRPGP